MGMSLLDACFLWIKISLSLSRWRERRIMTYWALGCVQKCDLWAWLRKEKKDKLSCVKLAICLDHPRRHRPLKFCMRGRVREVVIYFRFHENRSRGLGAVGGRKSPSPIDLAHGLYNSLTACTTVAYKPWCETAFVYHGLYGSTSCCISHGPSQWERAIFDPFLWHAYRSHFWTHPNAPYVVIRRFRQGSAFWGLERINLKFDPLYAQKT